MYCSCGRLAAGSCVGCGQPLCERHNQLAGHERSWFVSGREEAAYRFAQQATFLECMACVECRSCAGWEAVKALRVSARPLSVDPLRSNIEEALDLRPDRIQPVPDLAGCWVKLARSLALPAQQVKAPSRLARTKHVWQFPYAGLRIVSDGMWYDPTYYPCEVTISTSGRLTGAPLDDFTFAVGAAHLILASTADSCWCIPGFAVQQSSLGWGPGGADHRWSFATIDESLVANNPHYDPRQRPALPW